MLEFIPLLFPMVLNIVIGIVTLLLSQDSKRSGLVMIAISFFLMSIPSIVNLALGGPYMTLRLHEEGYTVTEIGLFHLYLYFLSIAFHTAFAVLFLVGLFKLSRTS